MARIACPYCCTIQTFPNNNVCEHCASEVPEKYLNAAHKASPFYLAVVGMTAHGKTTFLNSLAHAMDHLSGISDGSFLEPLDDKTVELMRGIRLQIANRDRAESTKPRALGATLQEPLLFTLKSFMTEDRHTLVIYDLAGESFRDRADIQEYAEPLKLCHTIWFVVSLHDLENQNSEYATIAELFNIYVTGMERVGANPRGRRLHVIYSKADKLINRLDDDIREYVRNDEYVNLSKQLPRDLRNKQFNAEQYISVLEANSEKLYDFTRYDVQGGMSFINMIKDTEMDLSFSVNSATGSDHSTAVRDFEAYRVIDPLVWALQANSDLKPQKSAVGSNVVLILDTGISSRSKIYGNMKLPSLFFTALSDFGEVTTYYMGLTTPVIQTGIAPTNDAPRDETADLIGPILDRVSPTAKVVVITCRTIRDFIDFHTPAWHERMAVITFEESYRVRRDDYYPYSATYDRSSPAAPIEQVRQIVNRLFKPSI